MPHDLFLSQSFPFLEPGHKRKYREELSLAIQESLEIPGALIRCLEPFFSSEGLQILMLSNPCRSHRDFIPLPRTAQATSRLPTKPLTKMILAFKKTTDPARKSLPPGLSPNIHLTISTYINTPEHTATPPPRMVAAIPFPTSNIARVLQCAHNPLNRSAERAPRVAFRLVAWLTSTCSREFLRT